ncbi:hypothetical protein POTOM_000903 [Populus tomentosa]|uniref:Uncharacterized protein n=1 Tax=Populus tomentosa TaxID=118781 RepID=A0A8X8DGW7_POPTO|nr:hypothetical protein POTOM_000903 [Populus tomentosa]
MGPGYPATPHCLNYYRQNLRDLPVKGMRGSHNKSQHFFYPAKCRLPGLKEPKMGLFFSSFYTLYLDNLNRGQLEIAGGSFSTPFIARDQAYSFTYESPVTGEDQQGQSPTLTSSFSSFLVNDNTPCSASEVLELQLRKGDFLFDAKVTDSKLDAIHGEVFPGKLPALSDTLVPVNRGIGERMQKIEIPQEGACAIRTLTGHLGRISLEESTSSDNGRHGKFWGCEELNSDDRLCTLSIVITFCFCILGLCCGQLGKESLQFPDSICLQLHFREKKNLIALHKLRRWTP